MKIKFFYGLILILTSLSLGAEPAESSLPRPKLVVGIVVDQMRWDYLYRYYDRYGDRGFKRLLKEGFTCENTQLNYLPAFTAVGHTCIYTGSVPSVTGIAANDFYIENDIWYRNPKRHLHELKATKLYNDQYPELEDFVLFLEDRLGQLEAKNPNSREIKAITRIFNTFDELKTSNADMFNGSTEFQDISSEQVVTFDLRGVKGKLLNVQMLSVLSLVSADMTNHGKRCNAMLQEDKTLTEMDMPHTIINVSQAQTLINPRYEKSVESLADMIEIMSSNYGGIVLSVSSLQGILFEEGSGSHKDPYNIAVKKIFGMMQYRVFAQTDETTIPLLANALRGSMNQSELETLPRLTKGQLFMNIAGQGNIVFNQQLLQPELERYGEIR